MTWVLVVNGEDWDSKTVHAALKSRGISERSYEVSENYGSLFYVYYDGEPEVLNKWLRESNLILEASPNEPGTLLWFGLKARRYELRSEED